MSANFDDFNDYIKQARENIQPTLSEIGEYMVTETTKRFQENKVRGQELSQATIDRKGNNLKLVDTTILKNSVEHYEGETFTRIGSPISYGEDHQVGKGVPKREWLFVEQNNMEDMADILIAGLFGDGND